MEREKSRKRKILCSCGTGVATCSFVSSEIKKFLKKNGIEAEFFKCRVSDLEKCSRDADVIISTCQLPPKIEMPRVSGVPFITGNDIEKARKELLDILK